MTGEAVAHLDGHCRTDGGRHHYHSLCPGRDVSTFGVEHVCECPDHDGEQRDAVAGAAAARAALVKATTEEDA